MGVNDNAPCLNDRVVRPFIASRLAPTGVGGPKIPVGASLLAMDVNDDACLLTERVVPRSIVGTPPGPSSLLQINDQRTPALRRADGVKSASL
jgi:hypothetical protein